ncbi:MAG TPA: hypothetical protein VE954_12430 [Oligoflexus sp.]|uniref:hypothetical protein n=1 Tax=Oligoflexus sp. TaxID=1971216 RepID=UPI002D536A0B|nr:hypothetical protein [Oligoflexus sp.]HYX33914.1 hypothetical protein [Oligoflexus sp.]
MKKNQTVFVALMSLPLLLALACGQGQTDDNENTDNNAGNSANNTPAPTSPNATPTPVPTVTPAPGTLSPTPSPIPPAPAPVENVVIRQAKGRQAADIQQVVDQFRLDLGGVNNVAAVGTQAQGHREINWDGVPADKSAPNLFPGDFFKVRGALFSSPGNQLQVSAKAAETPDVLFANINPALSKLFKAFSPEKLFAAPGSRVIDVTFTVPGSNDRATVTAFGSVFTDVDLAGHTRMEYFDLSGRKILTVPVPAVAHTDQSQSFVGVKFTDGTLITKVRIIMGNVTLNDFSNEMHGDDAVAADDFLYAEPQAEPLRL